MRRSTKIGIILLVFGLSFLASTVYRSESTSSFSICTFGSQCLEPNKWSAEGNLITLYFLAPRDLEMEIKTNATLNVYVLNAEGMHIWATEGRLDPIWAFKGVNQHVFTLEVPQRGEYGFLVYNPTNSSASFEINTTIYGYERDLLGAAVFFVITGTLIMIASSLISKFASKSIKQQKIKTPSKSIKTITLLVTLLILSCMVSTSQCVSLSVPTWFEKGMFAEYHFDSGYLDTPEGRTLVVNNTTIYLNYTSKRFDEATYRWECVDLNETTAKLKITLTTENWTSQRITHVFVDTANRAVYLDNGTLWGLTHLWLPDRPTPNDDIILWDSPPDKVTMRIENREEYSRTVQGRQKSFTIMGTGKIHGSTAIFAVMYDFDTGILIDGGLEHEPTLSALNVTSISGEFYLSGTNIDLGPPSDPIDLRTIFTIVAVPTALVVIFVALYRNQNKRKKH